MLAEWRSHLAIAAGIVHVPFYPRALQKMPLFRDRTVPRVQFSRGGCALNTYDRVQLLLLRAEAYQGLGKRKEAQNAVTRAEKVRRRAVRMLEHAPSRSLS